MAVRERLIELHDQGRGRAAIAARFGHGGAAVRRVRHSTSGSAAAWRRGPTGAAAKPS